MLIPTAYEVIAERYRQDAKWGSQRKLDDGKWLLIVMEEITEALTEGTGSPGQRKELIQCAAVLAAWIESLDSRVGIESSAKAIMNEVSSFTNTPISFLRENIYTTFVTFRLGRAAKNSLEEDPRACRQDLLDAAAMVMEWIAWIDLAHR